MQDTLKLGRLVGVKVGANWSLFALAAIVAYFLATSRLPADVVGYTTDGLLVGRVRSPRWPCWPACWSTRWPTPLRRNGRDCMSTASRSGSWAVSRGSKATTGSLRPNWSSRWSAHWPAGSSEGSRSYWPGSAQNAGWGLAAASLRWLGLINLLLGVFNLLPASPLDGGRVLHGLIWSVTKNRWLATRLAAGAGMVLGAACGVAGPAVLRAERRPRRVRAAVDGLVRDLVVQERAARRPSATRAGRRSGLRHHAAGRHCPRVG